MVSDFFEPPARYEPEPAREWDDPPHGQVPTTIPIELTVGRSNSAVVYLAAISAYATGFVFDLIVLTDGSDEVPAPFDFELLMLAERTGELQPGQLRLGFAFADGSKATNTGAHFDLDDEELNPRPTAPVMSRKDGWGDVNTWRHSFWVWPLPPKGRLEFVCEWPAAGIALIRTELEGAALLAAANRVT